MTKTRLKAPAIAVPVPADREACATAIRELGDQTRDLARLEAEMNDAIAEITGRYETPSTSLKNTIQALQTGIQAWCEAHRAELTDGGKQKTGHFVTGHVQWRQRPPSVAVRGIEAVLAWLKANGLGRFVRTREEIDKNALLNEPTIIPTVPGLSLKTGVEDFVIVPFEQELT